MGQRKRERKLTSPNTLPAVHRTKGLSKSRGASRLRTSPAQKEAGGRGSGKGAGSAPRTASPTTLQTGLQFLTKDLLRFSWSTSAGRVVAKHRAPTPDRAGGDWGWDRGGEKAHRIRGECARQAPGCLSRSDGEGTNRRRSLLFRTFVEHPGAGTARSTGPAP